MKTVLLSYVVGIKYWVFFKMGGVLMSIVVVADSSCDLPQKYWDSSCVEVFPFGLLIDGVPSEDSRNPDMMTKFFKEDLVGKQHTAESMPLSKEKIIDYFNEKIVTKYDFALILTAAKGRSETYQNFMMAANDIVLSYRPYREAAGLKTNFNMRVINSGTLFAGLGVLVSHMMDLVEQGLSTKELRISAEVLRNNIYTYCVPHDLYYLSTRAKAKGDKSVSVFAALIAKLFNIIPVILGHMDETSPVAKFRGYKNTVNRVFKLTCLRIDAGLESPRVVVSYAGDIKDLKRFSGYRRLVKHAKANDVKVETSVMSIVGGLNLGPKTLTVGFASQPHTFE